MNNSWTSQLIGLPVIGVEHFEGCPCIVKLQGGYWVQIETLWRLSVLGTLVRTSRDDGQSFAHGTPVTAVAELSSKLTGLTITGAEVATGTADLGLHFGKHVLQVISDSAGYEAWQVGGPEGTLAVGQGGGNVIVFAGAA